MSYFSTADPRPKNIHVRNYDVDRVSTLLNQVTSNHPETSSYAGPMFNVDDVSSSRPLTSGHLQIIKSAGPQQVQSSVRPHYWAVSSNIPTRVAQFDLPQPQKVRVPLAPRSCPPCSPVTRIFPSMSADGTVSPGTKTVSFEVDNNISDDHILMSVQELRENLEKKGKPQYEVIPVLQLKDPPKGKGKRPLSSDSDSFSSDLTNSSVSFNSSVTSDSLQKSLKSPEDLQPPNDMSSQKSPKKVKGDADSISPPLKILDSTRPQPEDKRLFESRDCIVKLPVFTFPQSPSRADNFCSTPLGQVAGIPNTIQPVEKTRGRPEGDSPYRNVDSRESRTDIMRRASSSTGLHVANSDSRAMTKSLSMPKADVSQQTSFQPSRLKIVDNTQSYPNNELHNISCKTKYSSTVHQTRHGKSVEPSVFVFPDVKKNSNDDEVDGFGSESHMDMDVDNYDNGKFQFGQHNPFQGTVAFQSQCYGIHSNESQMHYSQGLYRNSLNNYENQKSTLQPNKFSHGDSAYCFSDTYPKSAQTYSDGCGRIYGDDLDSAGTLQFRAKQKNTEVVRTPKDNRSTVAPSYVDILDINEKYEDIDQALAKFSDNQVGGQGNYMSSKQDLNNNTSRNNGLCSSRQFRNEDSCMSTAPVNTKADTNVCFISLHELPDSDMSCDDMENYGRDDEDAVLMGYTPAHAGRYQRYWDETDGLQSSKEDANVKSKSSKGEIDTLGQHSSKVQKTRKGTPKVSKEKYSSCEKRVKVSIAHNTSDKFEYGDVGEHTRSSSSLNKRNGDTCIKDYTNISSSTKSLTAQTKPLSNSSPTSLARPATLNKTSEIKLSLPVETKANLNRNCPDRYEEISLKNIGPPSVGQLRENAHPTPIHKKAQTYKSRQDFFKHPTTCSETKALRHHPWVPASSSHNGRYVYEDDDDDSSSGGDEVDGFGDDKAATPNKDIPGARSSPSKRAALDNKDDVVHCFDTSDHEDSGDIDTVAAQQIQSSLHSRTQLVSLPTMHGGSSNLKQNLECPNFGTNSVKGGFTPKKQTCEVGFNTPICKPAYNDRMDFIPCTKPNLLNAKDLYNNEAIFIESSPDPRSSSSSKKNQPHSQHHCTESRDDISMSCVTSHELKDIFPRRASDTSGTISPNHVIPRTRSSPSKLENNSSGEKFRKVTFHRPWVTTDEAKMASQISSLNVLQPEIPNVSSPQSIITTQSAATRIADTLGCPPLQNYRTPESNNVLRHNSTSGPNSNNVLRHNSTSDPNRYSDQLRSEINSRAVRGDSPAKRNRVDRRLDFESLHQTMDKSQQQIASAAASSRAPGAAPVTTFSNSSRPELAKLSDTDSASAFREYDVASSGIKINGNPQGASAGQLDGACASKTAANRGASGSPETETKLKRIQNLISSRGESGNSREDNEIDIKIEVSDSLRLSERLEQIYQSNDRRCECARIEQEILTKAMDLFGELCDPSKKFDNWKATLRATNADIRQSLEIADDCRRLCSHGRTVSDVFPGSVVLRVKCRTLMSVVDLCHMHSSGELHGLLSRMLCSRAHMIKLALKVSIDQENIMKCTQFLFRALQLTERPSGPSQRKFQFLSADRRPESFFNTQSKGVESTSHSAPMNSRYCLLHSCPDRRSGQGLSNCVRSSPSTPTVRIAKHARCSSSPSIYIHSPVYGNRLTTPATPGTPDRRERTFSFGETRIALQELDGPTSPLGPSSRWNCSPRQTSSPLPPHLRTPPITSPVTSPRKLKRCDVIQEQENMGSGSVEFTS